VKSLFGAVGLVEEVPENLMGAVTGVSGSGPAYIYIIIEALADAGVRHGLPRPTALRLAAQTGMLPS
jgi:pyrroline-5-carboxylate reductase